MCSPKSSAIKAQCNCNIRHTERHISPAAPASQPAIPPPPSWNAGTMYRAKMCALHWGNACSGAQNEANVWSGQTFNTDRKRFPICRDRRSDKRCLDVALLHMCVSGCALLFSVCMCNRSSSSSSSTAFKMLLRRQCATFFVRSAGTGETGRFYTYIYNYNSTVRRIEFSPVHFACIFLLHAAFAPI